MTHTRRHRGGQGTGASKIAPAPQAPQPRPLPRPIPVPPAQIIPAAPKGGRTRRRRGGSKYPTQADLAAMSKAFVAKTLKKMEQESLLEASKRVVRHAKSRKHGKKISADKYYEYPKNGRY